MLYRLMPESLVAVLAISALDTAVTTLIIGPPLRVFTFSRIEAEADLRAALMEQYAQHASTCSAAGSGTVMLRKPPVDSRPALGACVSGVRMSTKPHVSFVGGPTAGRGASRGVAGGAQSRRCSGQCLR